MTVDNALVPRTMNEAIRFSTRLAASSLVPKDFQGKPEDILVAMQWGNEVGLPIMSALQNICVINGKPTIYGDAALALVTSHPQYAGHKEWLEGDDAHCLIRRTVSTGEVVETERTFSMGDAQRARLNNKAGPWKDYPKRMLQMRARGFAIRDAFPDAIKGISIDDDRPIKDVDVTPANPLDATFGEQPPENDPLGSPLTAITKAPIPKVPEDIAPPVGEPVRGENEVPWELRIDNEVIECLDADMWHGEFVEAIGRAANEDGVSLEDRRHNASVIKKVNDETIERLQGERPELGADIYQRYERMIKALSAMARNEKDRA